MNNKINEKVMYTSYKRSNKWLGMIDYKSLFFLLIYIFVIITILETININLETAFYIFLFLTVPVISIVLINVGNESAVSVVFSIILFFLKRGIYVQNCDFKAKRKKYKKI